MSKKKSGKKVSLEAYDRQVYRREKAEKEVVVLKAAIERAERFIERMYLEYAANKG